MFKTSLRTVGAAILSLAAIAAAPTASAAVVSGSWDPVLPAPFVNLGWVATVNLGISNNCVVGTTNTYAVEIFGTSFGCTNRPAANNFDILRAQVGLYSTLTGLIIEVLQFAPPPPGGMGVDLSEPSTNNFLLSLNSSSAGVDATSPDALGFKFKLAVPGALPVLFYKPTGPGNTGTFIPATGTPLLTEFSVRPDAERDAILLRTALSEGQSVAAPAAVPEPGSLALVLLALAAAGATAARSTRRTDQGA